MTIESIETARNRPPVAIESPFAGDRAANEAFARKACAFAITKGYAPFAMHLFFPLFLNDHIEEERNIGIGCGLAWTSKAIEVWFCLREGDTITPGMQKALDVETARKGTSSERPVRMLRFAPDGSYLNGF